MGGPGRTGTIHPTRPAIINITPITIKIILMMFARYLIMKTNINPFELSIQIIY